MTTLVFQSPETRKRIQECLNDPEFIARISSPESRAAYAAGCLRVRRMSAQRRATLAVDPEIYRAKITI